MNIKDEALKMAIEAIELSHDYICDNINEESQRITNNSARHQQYLNHLEKDLHKCDQAIQACEEALKQPAMTYEQGFAHGYEAHRVEQELEQPAQEPVAWRVLLDESPEDTDWHYMTGEPWECFKQSAEPLYTHPAPSWQGLSDGEIQEHLGDELVTLHGWSFVQGVRWADKKLKEKNDGTPN